MRIGLYNVDSVIPNLALMKLSAYHKAKGDDVKWYLPLETYDKVYASKVFTDSHIELNNGMVVGGSGCDDMKRKLPAKVDACKPDYSIYPDCDYSIGYTTRGCIRKCKFCFVPKMEGKIQYYRAVSDIWRGQGNLVLLDNNILAQKGRFLEVLKFCKAKNIKVDFNQGLDCRLVHADEIAIIKRYRRYITKIRFAFDDLSYDVNVEYVCRKLGFACFWYVYCDENWENALERLLFLKRLGQRPYLMRDKSVRGIKKFNFLAHWVNRPMMFQKVDIIEYYPIYYRLTQKKLQGQQALFDPLSDGRTQGD